ncbi:uncharacterized protein LAESUDRAFT_764059 [Laetiporus sulphureus 93-53]|uniref:Uncharacterized protein n=1 Tax=Laetiporus sulphureus 93-53 TaxID=1314785 RepID=A0A165BGP4_9APHY|nr:uncharacterized protein LAESUDRAFT_764059 [Laetiporus sulphureus 93-53]KZT01021.1 hypothetical protein LAESUDRAFT_764059 [Laetiporus sulphureus 93-53]
MQHLSALDIETISAMSAVPTAITDLQRVSSRLHFALGKIGTFSNVVTKITRGAHRSIAHPRICSASRTLIRLASASIILALSLVRHAKGNLDTSECIGRYQRILQDLESAVEDVDKLEYEAEREGYIPIPEDFLSGPRSDNIRIYKECQCSCHLKPRSMPVFPPGSIFGPSGFAGHGRHDHPVGKMPMEEAVKYLKSIGHV